MIAEVKSYDARYFKQWNQLIAQSNHATFMLDRNFMEYHQERFQDASIVLVDADEKLIACLPANRVADKIYSHQGLSYGGFVFSPKLTIEKKMTAYRKGFEFYKKQGMHSLVYKALPPYYHKEEHQAIDLIARLGGSLVNRETSSVVDLQQEKTYQKRRKRMIARALKQGLKVETTDQLTRFWAVLEANLLKRYQKAPVHTLEEISLLANRFPKHIKLIQATYEEQVVGGMLLFDSNPCVHAQYIASNEIGRQYGALDLIVDAIIDQYKLTHRYFSLGISDDRQSQTINKGLKEWKDGFGARDFYHSYYQYQF
ncbi:MAG: GNAT family N-acetyltransferase [Flammeovirgaceae bacterium]